MEENIEKFKIEKSSDIEIKKQTKIKKEKELLEEETKIKLLHEEEKRNIKDDVLKLEKKKISLRENYFKNKKLREEEKNKLKINRSKIVNKIKENTLFFDNKIKTINIDIERITNRIKYLNKKYNIQNNI